MGRGDFVSSYSSITIPYVSGDNQGDLTTEIIKAFSQSGVSVSGCCGRLLLEICLFSPNDENIGYTFAYTEDGTRTKIVASNEARISATAKVTLIDQCSGRRLLGPCSITAYTDFDFEPDLSTVNSHDFALGQLEMHPQAFDVAKHPLYRCLAEKIVDYVVHNW